MFNRFLVVAKATKQVLCGRSPILGCVLVCVTQHVVYLFLNENKNKSDSGGISCDDESALGYLRKKELVIEYRVISC